MNPIESMNAQPVVTHWQKKRTLWTGAELGMTGDSWEGNYLVLKNGNDYAVTNQEKVRPFVKVHSSNKLS